MPRREKDDDSELCCQLSWFKSYLRETILPKMAVWTFRDLWGLIINATSKPLGSGFKKSGELSFFGFFLAIMESKFEGSFLEIPLNWKETFHDVWWTQYLLKREIDWNSFILIFDELWVAFPFLTTTPRSRDRKGAGSRDPTHQVVENPERH